MAPRIGRNAVPAQGHGSGGGAGFHPGHRAGRLYQPVQDQPIELGQLSTEGPAQVGPAAGAQGVAPGLTRKPAELLGELPNLGAAGSPAEAADAVDPAARVGEGVLVRAPGGESLPLAGDRVPAGEAQQPALRLLQQLGLPFGGFLRAAALPQVEDPENRSLPQLPQRSTSPSFPTSTTAAAPSLISPASTLRARGFCTRFWMVRFRGRAPYSGSKPASAR